MDITAFKERLEEILTLKLRTSEIRILKDNFPTSVNFIIISSDFDGLSRGARIRLVANFITEAFSPISFRALGRGITPEEYDDEMKSGEIPYEGSLSDSGSGTAARSRGF